MHYFLRGEKKKKHTQLFGSLFFPALLAFSYFPALLQDPLSFAAITEEALILLAVLTYIHIAASGHHLVVLQA